MASAVRNALLPRWTLTATYEGGKTRNIAMTASMFYMGYKATSPGTIGDASIMLNPSDGNVFSGQVDDLKKLALSTNPQGASSAMVFYRDWPLPVYYRGESDDETVKVTVFYRPMR